MRKSKNKSMTVREAREVVSRQNADNVSSRLR